MASARPLRIHPRVRARARARAREVARLALSRICCIIIPGALLCEAEDAPAARQERIAIEEGLGES